MRGLINARGASSGTHSTTLCLCRDTVLEASRDYFHFFYNITNLKIGDCNFPSYIIWTDYYYSSLSTNTDCQLKVPILSILSSPKKNY